MIDNSVEHKMEKVPPQNIEAEQAVLGALLINPVAITRVVETLKVESFYKQAHKYIYSSMLDLFKDNNPIDVITVSNNLKISNNLEKVGGRAYVNDLALSVVTTANIEYYAKIVSEKFVLRELIKAGTEIVSLVYEESDANQAMDTAEKLIFSIAQRKTMDNIIHIKDIVLDSYNLIEKRYNNRDELIGTPSGFYDLDNMTTGFQPSDLIIIAARPSMGKTAFCLNIAQEVSIRRKNPVVIFSLEMSKEQLVQRMLCTEAGINTTRLRTGHMQSDDWAKLNIAMGDLADSPLFIDDSPGTSVMEVRAKCRRLSMEYGNIGLIIIDYLQLMEGSRSGKMDRVHEISAISRGLKNLARELKLPIIALSQLSRAVETRTNKKPMLSDLRESGSIEQDADIVMFIYREEYYDQESPEKKGKAEIIVSKQRNGPTGSVDLIFDANCTKFKNPAITKNQPLY
ncbi:MAG: replicative DNA helicase [bacterium]